MPHVTPDPRDTHNPFRRQPSQPEASHQPPSASSPLAKELLPGTPITSEQINAAKELLASEKFGVSYGQVLRDIANNSWVFSTYPDQKDLRLTRRLVEFNPELHSEYTQARTSDTFVSTALSLVPFIGRPLRSTEFLATHTEINQVIEDMKHAELLEVGHIIQSEYLRGFGSTSHSFWTLHVTDAARLVLQG